MSDALFLAPDTDSVKKAIFDPSLFFYLQFDIITGLSEILSKTKLICLNRQTGVKMIKISPSILSSDFSKLGEEIKFVADAGAELIHIDVMDGMFVPNITLGPCVIKSVRKACDKIFDTHLMINDPIRYVGDFAEAGSDIITFHFESCTNHVEVIKRIHSFGKKAGISIKPATPAFVLEPLLPLIDMVLVMTVEPGFGGQSFIPETLESVKIVKEMLTKLSLEDKVDIEVDGGITPDTAPLVKEAGANVLVAGSAVFKAEDRAAAIAAIRG